VKSHDSPGEAVRRAAELRRLRQEAGITELIEIAQAATAVLERPLLLPPPVPRQPPRYWAARTGSAAFLAVSLAAVFWVGITFTPVRYAIYAVWMLPLAELALLAAGQAHYRLRFRTAPPGKYTELIIQVTTAGREHGRVSEIIGQIRSYRLPMKHRIWVVTEPGDTGGYPGADAVLAPPASFTARSQRKARALEFSRLARQKLGLARPDVKVLFNDDDVSLTRAYIMAAWGADYDICQGIVAPRTEYGVGPFGHFLASHADDIRTHACLVYCSVFQGILRRPLHVHGEGLTVTGEAERLVTWDWPAFASEDLVFGQRAAEIGLRWGWFREYAEVTSPWGLRDFVTQRGRWLWGDIHGITHRDVMSRRAAALTAAKYGVGSVSLMLSAAGLWLRVSGRIPGDSPIFGVAKLSVLAWAAVYFTCGWAGASSRVFRRPDDSRLLAATVAVLMLPVSLLLTFAGMAVPLVQGNPRTFHVIGKTRGTR
jgi:hypothetical protein